MHNGTIKFLKSNPDILFIKANKGNITIALNKDEYINKIEEIL